MTEIETHYLVIGAGAAGMAFTDELIAHRDVEVVIVDRRHRPGGHWNDGYPFLRLHQPSAFYGVNSRMLGSDSIDETGPNAGFYERATVTEICDYYDEVLEHHLLPSGKVRFSGGCDYVGDWADEHVVVSRLTGEATSVRVRARIVDARYLESSVPARHTPGFDVDPDAWLVPVGEIVDLAEPPAGFTVLGAGKTGMDACSWLLENGVDPDAIRWIKPRESWAFDRASFQPLDLLPLTMERLSYLIASLAQAEHVDEVFRRLEERDVLVRVDETVEPTMFKGAILSRAEREHLRQVENVVRLGRVRHLGPDRMVLDGGTIPTRRGEVHVDCTADGLPGASLRPVFESGRITLQSLQGGQTSNSAATAGFVEATRCEDAEKNRLCPPAPNPSRASDLVRMMRHALRGYAARSADPDLLAWSERSRVSLTRGKAERMGDARLVSAMARWLENIQPAIANAERLLHEEKRARVRA